MVGKYFINPLLAIDIIIFNSFLIRSLKKSSRNMIRMKMENYQLRKWQSISKILWYVYQCWKLNCKSTVLSL